MCAATLEGSMTDENVKKNPRDWAGQYGVPPLALPEDLPESMTEVEFREWLYASGIAVDR